MALLPSGGRLKSNGNRKEPFRMNGADFDLDETEAEARLAALPASQRALVEDILRVTPGYRYDLSPMLDPQPAPGLPSALAAVAAMVARIKAKAELVD